MKSKGSKFFWVISCAGEKGVRTESHKNIDEILKSGLATITEEEPETCLDEAKPPVQTLDGMMMKKKKKRRSTKTGRKARLGHRFASFGDMYAHFMVGFASRGS